MTNVDALLITPPSRLDVYQSLSKDYAAIEPPVWSSLIANYKTGSPKLNWKNSFVNDLNYLIKKMRKNLVQKKL